MKLLSAGIAKCTYEPRGEFGLEGFALGDTYLFQRREGAHKYVRIWAESAGNGEYCRPFVFGKYFEVVEEFNFNANQ